MAIQLKQRIVGILVLLFLALIILPWLFGSNQRAVFEEKHARNARASNSPIREINQSTVNLEKTTQESPQTVSPVEPVAPLETIMPQPKIKPGPTTYKTVQNDDDEDFEKPNKEITEEKLSQIQSSVIHTESKAFPVKAVVAKEKAVKSKKTITEITMPEPKTVFKNVDKQSAKWTIQLGSFSDTQNADQLVKKLKEKGFSAYSKLGKNAKGDEVTRVLVKPSLKHNRAEDTLSNISDSLNLHGVIVKAGA